MKRGCYCPPSLRIEDPLHYHTKVRFKGITDETDKAFKFLMLDGTSMWFPKKWCKQLRHNTVYMWKIGYARKLMEAFS